MQTDTLERLAFTLGDRLAKAREVADLTSTEMGVELGVSRIVVSNYEHGRTVPTKAVLRVWAEVTGAPLEWLLTGRLDLADPTPGRVEGDRSTDNLRYPLVIERSEKAPGPLPFEYESLHELAELGATA